MDSKSSHVDIDWDKLAKSKMPLENETRAAGDTHTVPPPVSYESQSAALKPTLGDPHEASLMKRKRHTDHTDTDSHGWYTKSFLIN